MKPFILVALVLLAASHVDRARAQDVPAVTLKYSTVPFDPMCEELTRYRHMAHPRLSAWEIDRTWKQELAGRVAEFQAHWDAEASTLLGTALQEVGRPFPHREMIATLTLCAVGSMSNPLIISMRQFLHGPTKGDPRSKLRFASLVFHELLHSYVAAHRPPTTPILLEHQATFDRSVIVRNHVHLFALMQIVYQKLGRGDDLQKVIEAESSGPDPDYRLAWELVQKIGADRLVAELKGP
jgi:hypothetical protein